MSRATDLLQGIADRFAEVESLNQRVAALYLNENDLRCILEAAPRDYHPVIDTASAGEDGLQGTMWGAYVYTSNEVPLGSLHVRPEICAALCQPIKRLAPLEPDFCTDLG
jgi:hypothetical protein